MTTGFNADKSLGVQIKPGKECVVTTEPQPDEGLSLAFMEMLTAFSGKSAVQEFPAVLVIEGGPFIVTHDRRGEAIVILGLE